MSVHELGLQPQYYQLIKDGIKEYEVRLNDEKRKLINVGDEILIKKDPERSESFVALVVNKIYFKTFLDMAKSLDAEKIGFKGSQLKDIVAVYRKFYSEEQEKKYGVVALQVKIKA